MFCLLRLMCCGVILIVVVPARAAEYNLDPDLPYQARRSEPVQHEVDFSVVVTPPYKCKVLKVWLPVPQTDAAQVISDSRFESFPQKVTAALGSEPTYGNRFAYFEFHKPQGAQIIRHRFKARVWDLNWDVTASKVETVKTWPAAFARYAAPQTIADGRAFERVLQQIAPERRNAGEDLMRVMEWIDKNLTYDHAGASLRADANHAFSQLRGHCSDYHGLCATMGRALGYPTRMTYGLSLFPKNSPSHCRVEAFLPGYGWVSFDISETQKLVKRINDDARLDGPMKERLTQAARERLRRGFRENSWLLMTRGANYELAPKASQPVPIVRTAYIEADGEPLAEPDPADARQRQFSWMTVHDYHADRSFPMPFEDYTTLKAFVR